MNSDIPKLEIDSKEELSNIFERVARKYLAHSESDLAVSSTYGNVAVQAAATATDRMQLLRGQPTSISGESLDPKAYMQRRIDKLSAKTGRNPRDIALELQSGLSDKTDEDYSPELDQAISEVVSSFSAQDSEITEIGDQ